MQNTVLKTATLGVMLVGLWLMLKGCWNIAGLYFLFHGMAGFVGFDLSGLSGVLVALWKALPLFVGAALCRHPREVALRFCRNTDGEKRNSPTWDDTDILAALAISFLGLIFVSYGLNEFCDNNFVLAFILELSDSRMPPICGAESRHLAVLNRIYLIFPVIYPLFVGTALLWGAGRAGRFMEKRIERSLDRDSENDSEDMDLPKQQDNGTDSP